MHKLRSCEDFQALIPEYLGKNLPEARRLLLDDHLHQCVACRHAVEQARGGELQPVWQPKLGTRRFPVWRWAMGAAAAFAIGVTAVALANGIFPGQHVVRGAVQNVDGSLYAVVDDQVRVIPAGYQIRNGDQIRTAKGSHAEVRLLDGSLVEMGERSDLSVSREWRGTTIHLDGGHIIVQAAKQRTGRLYVATDDCLVSVKGTIFSVNHGTKGSRVAVIEGVVRVASGDQTTDLYAGDEADFQRQRLQGSNPKRNCLEPQFREISGAARRLCAAAKADRGDSWTGAALQFRPAALRSGQHGGLCRDSQYVRDFGRGWPAFSGPVAAESGAAELVEGAAAREGAEARRRD